MNINIQNDINCSTLHNNNRLLFERFLWYFVYQTSWLNVYDVAKIMVAELKLYAYFWEFLMF